MYFCHDCESEFEDPIVIRDFVGYYGSEPAYQRYAGCPYCKSDDVEEMQECYECGDHYLDEDLTEGLCGYCHQEAEEE